jgi:energy-coupling factor transporter transmembrane protein EcfT
MGPIGKPNINKLTVAVFIFMLFPISLSIYGIHGYIVGNGPHHHESLYFVGFMALLSLVVFIPFAVLLAVNWRQIKVVQLALAITPFVAMALMYQYALNNGLPM